MNVKQRSKLGAGAGLVTMLLGALMVLAPSAGAVLVNGVWELPARGGAVPLCHATDSETNPYIRNEPNVSATGEFFGSNHASHLGPVFAEGMKSAKPRIVWGDIIPPISVNGVMVFGGSPNWSQGGAEQYAECSAATPDAPVVIVEKDVPGEADDPTDFDFDVTWGQDEVDDDTIADGESFETEVVAGQVVVTETEAAGYSLTGVSCTRDYGTGDDVVEDEAVPVTRDGTSVALTAVAGDIITCTFTNTPDTHGVTVVKKNDANGDTFFNPSEVAPSAGNPVKFQVELTNTGNQDLEVATLTDTWTGLATPINLLSAPDLACTRASATVVLTTALPAGTTTTCTFTLGGYAPAAGTSRLNRVAVTTAEGPSGHGESTVSTPQNVIIIETPTTTTTAPPAPASLRVSKVVEAVGGGEAPATWSVQFDVIGDGFDASRTLDQDLSTASLGELEAGTYTVTEVLGLNDTSSLTDVECVELSGGDVDMAEDLEGDRATVVLEEGDDVLCTFTNSYPAVLPGGEEPEPEPQPAEETPKPTTVLGDVVTRPRALPRTGGETKGLAGAGMLLVALGAAMVLGSKRQLARR